MYTFMTDLSGRQVNAASCKSLEIQAYCITKGSALSEWKVK